MQTDSIQVSITASMAGLTDGLKSAASEVEKSAADMAGALQSTGRAANDTGKAHGSLLDTLREFRSEQVQQGRMARFYAGELASIIPSAGGAQGAMQGLLGAGLELAAGGGILAVGFEVAKVAIEAVTAAMVEDEQHAKAMQKAYADAFTSATDAMQKFVTVSGGVSDAWDKATDPAKKRIGELKKEIDELQNGSGWRALASGFTLGLVSTKDDDGIQKRRDEIATLMAGTFSARESQEAASNARRKQQEADTDREIAAIHASTASQHEQIEAALALKIAEINRRDFEDSKEKQRLIEAEVAKAAEQEKRIREDAEIQHQAKMLALASDHLTKIQILERQAAIEIKKLREDTARDPTHAAANNEEIAARKRALREAIEWEKAAQQQKLNDLAKAADDSQRGMLERQFAYQQQQDARLATKMQEQFDLRRGLLTQGSEAYMEELRTEYAETVRVFGEASTQAAAKRKELAQQEIANARQMAEGVVGAFVSVGNAIARVFVEVANHSKTMEEGFAEVARSMLRTTVETVQRIVQMMAVEAAAKAFAASNFLPGIGIALGAAAASTAFGAVMALAGSLPGYADGGRYNGGPMIVGERGPELLIPDGGGTVVPNHQLGGNLTIHINAVDGPSVRRLVEHPEFARTIREAQRNGRMG